MDSGDLATVDLASPSEAEARGELPDWPETETAADQARAGSHDAVPSKGPPAGTACVQPVPPPSSSGSDAVAGSPMQTPARAAGAEHPNHADSQEDKDVILDFNEVPRGRLGDTVMEQATIDFELTGSPPPPTARFIRCAKGDIKEGARRWQDTLQWRVENQINALCRSPQPHFSVIKQRYPTFMHLKSKEGYNVYYEKVGRIDLRGLTKSGITLEDLMRHYLFVTEFLYTYISPDEDSRTITVIDCAHLAVRRVPGEVLKFIKTANHLLGQHWPEKAAHVFIVNVPIWFKVIWSMVHPFIDPVTLKKIHVLRTKSASSKALLEHIDSANLPVEYGGTCPIELGKSPEEKLLQTLVTRLNERS